MALVLFRAFSAGTLRLPLPGPMAQAITVRAFGAGASNFDTDSSAFETMPLNLFLIFNFFS
jgi:hypothetical protein